ncbi:glycosyltransferase family 4 protein [Treponema brennaborense]|uniref:Glycosyl transferase group 1 n=1 Tax=Treponema brennaborense (strain DSM 12168 / CIP 105900 / DD5/3) TaxID=906968 RepID=F4LK11_TREBD|nr:glycosyltransferase family 4 protein [Treponema brennaborense]AEE17473.1 glycosyl transferase group 1 [Treponema brennaborense DSM 12168]
MKICFLTPRFPFPENGGDVLRINSIARYLKSKGNELILISFCFGEIKLKKEYFDLYDTIYVVKKCKLSSYVFAFLFALCQKPLQCGYYFSASFLRQFKRTLIRERPDECVAHLLRMVPYLEKTRVREKSIVEMTDALSKTYAISSQTKRNSLKKFIYQAEFGLIKKYERRVIRTFPKVVLVSQSDIDYLKDMSETSGENLFLHTNGVTVNENMCINYNSKKICFIGNMRTLQNQDAVLFFVNEVFPLIKKTEPETVFYIIGAEPSEKIKNLSDDKSIFVTGFVKNIESAIADSCLAIAPVKIAAGIQNKVLTAMSCAVPVVMTSLISGAIPELSDGKNCIIRDFPGEMAEACLQLMKNAEFRQTVSKAGLEMVLNHYSWNEKLAGYEKIPRNAKS